ncbi:MAG: nitrogen regulation protein NR(II) [Pseudomonadota bacterium]
MNTAALVLNDNGFAPGDGLQGAILNAVPHPILMVDKEFRIQFANIAAEAFFQSSMSVMKRHPLDYFIPFGSPVLTLIDQALSRNAAVKEYRVDVGSPRIGPERIVDLYASPSVELAGSVVLMLQERSIADKMDRQLTHRGAARSVTGLAAMLAHEIKNPLSGIRGAAQLLEQAAGDDDRALTRLITDEADRIVKLVDRMDVFSDDRPIEREAVNIHHVLEHVKRLGQSGVAQYLRITERYDPSLPAVFGNRDQLVQVFLNLIKNAAEALEGQADGEIVLTTAYRPGIRLSTPGSEHKVSLPLEVTVADNGKGVPNELLPHLFDPFVTTKNHGSGLGLALVAKIIGDHGGIIECDTNPGKTVFRVLLPAFHGTESRVTSIATRSKKRGGRKRRP